MRQLLHVPMLYAAYTLYDPAKGQRRKPTYRYGPPLRSAVEMVLKRSMTTAMFEKWSLNIYAAGH